jgi:hypothetical protein
VIFFFFTLLALLLIFTISWQQLFHFDDPFARPSPPLLPLLFIDLSELLTLHVRILTQLLLIGHMVYWVICPEVVTRAEVSLDQQLRVPELEAGQENPGRRVIQVRWIRLPNHVETSREYEEKEQNKWEDQDWGQQQTTG